MKSVIITACEDRIVTYLLKHAIGTVCTNVRLGEIASMKTFKILAHEDRRE
jgi:hypothetical protein